MEPNQEPTDLFASLDLLFPRSKLNPIDLCELRWRKRERDGTPRPDPRLLVPGDFIRDDAFTLKPVEDHRRYEGSQLGHAIAGQINQDYFLVALWERLVENAKYSELAREMVRAFVFQCGLVIIESLYEEQRVIDHAYVTGQGLMNVAEFYRRAFNWSQVYRLMRLRQRETLREKIVRNRDCKRLHRCQDADVAAALPTLNRVLAQSGLPELVSGPQVQNARGILVTLTMMCLTWRRDHALRRGLTKVLLRPMIL